MDKSFPEFLLVPYRPISGKMAKDLKNTFLFTMDSLQVTETAYKEHHPEIFSAPFITIRFVFCFENSMKIVTYYVTTELFSIKINILNNYVYKFNKI